MKLDYVEVHTPLFLNGINLGTKLDPRKRATLKLTYNADDKFLTVYVGEAFGLVPKENIVILIPTKVVSEPKLVKVGSK
jgi:hypothetical protein